jgi:ribosomal protein S18 acetylase RimI-like enzyme
MSAQLAIELCALDELTRAAERDDVFRQIEAIEKKSFPKHESLAEFIRHEAKGRARTLLVARLPPQREAQQPQVVVGYLLFERSAIVAHILKIAVLESVRRRGVGRALVAEAAQRAHTPARDRISAAARPMATMTLHVDPAREGAVGLYAAMGFRETSRRVDYYCPGRDAAFMELDLAAADWLHATSPSATPPGVSRGGNTAVALSLSLTEKQDDQPQSSGRARPRGQGRPDL